MDWKPLLELSYTEDLSVISCLILFIKGGVGVFKNPPSSGSCYEYCVQYFFKIIYHGVGMA